MKVTDTTRDFDEAEAGLLSAWLREELDVQRGLETALAALGERIVAQDPQGLEAVLVDHRASIDRMESLAARRQRMLGHLLARAASVVEPGCVERLIARMPEETHERLEAIHADVRETAQRVRRLNNRNGMLIRQTLRINENLVRRMFSSEAGASTYTADGRTTTAADMILDRRI